MSEFPSYNSPDLHLTHPTPSEKLATWNLNYEEWGKALSKSDYLHREEYLASVPLTTDGGMSYWILVSKTAAEDCREVYASCESLRKRAFISKDGVVEESTIHSIGSVFTPPKFRGHKYASRMMNDLGSILQTWQRDPNIPGRDKIPASILFSDIGKKFYATHGWLPFPSSHIALPPLPKNKEKNAEALENGIAKPLSEDEIPALCELDTKYIRSVLERTPPRDNKIHIALLPDYRTIQWHHLRENVMSTSIFGHAPTIKGAIAGPEGARIWAYWTRGYYGPIDDSQSGNTLHILRLVLEDERVNRENVEKLEAVLRFAQMEAGQWGMKEVQFWNPTELVGGLIEQGKVGEEGKRVEREVESVACLRWYGFGEGGGNGEGKTDGKTNGRTNGHAEMEGEEVIWWGNEKYGWC